MTEPRNKQVKLLPTTNPQRENWTLTRDFEINSFNRICMIVANGNKISLVYAGVVITILCIVIIILSWFSNIEWKESISYAGSFASVCGILIVIIQTTNVAKTTETVKEAVKENNKAITKLFTLNDIAKHLQMIIEIEAYINDNRWDVAHLRLNEMRLIIEDISANVEKYKIEKNMISNCLIDIKEDLRNLNKAIHNKENIDKLVIANHLDAIGPILHKVKQTITSTENDSAEI